jgi:hypothetical protein|tara:strand:- start:404 stop:595 length:192 start_codon:yes stop_codon:yes gene_type:complete
MRANSQDKKRNDVENAQEALWVVIENLREILRGLDIQEEERWDIENALKYSRDILKEIRRELE